MRPDGSDNNNSVELKQDAYPDGVQKDSEGKMTMVVTPASEVKTFPYPGSEFRIQDYGYYKNLFLGDHWTAFNIRINDERYTKEYAKLRYIAANLPGLMSKIIADMLFSEPPNVKMPEDGDQDFIDAVIEENHLNVQNYESALSNSALGDAVYKIRIGKRNPSDEKVTLIIEDINPVIYFPKVDAFNVRGEPSVKELAWTFEKDNKKFLRREVHSSGKIENHIYLMKGEEILGEVPLTLLPELGLVPQEDTKIKESLIIHIPNWKMNDRHFGISDYRDLDKIFYAINNRLTKIDAILDKHSDPILIVPPGVLDAKGQVSKKTLGVMEVREGETGKPEYVVWDASLENAFKEIEKFMEVGFMVAEISPDILGMGTGSGDSGRAIRLKVMRTLAKAARKKTYYDIGIKQVLYVAQVLAKAWDVEVGGLKLTKEPAMPEIEWQDGLPVIEAEQVDIEAKRLDAGLTTTVDSIMRLDGVDEDTAEEKAKAIKDENKLDLQMTTSITKPFGKPGADGKPIPGNQMPMKDPNNTPPPTKK